MEDVLAVYTRPRDPDRRLVCLDETSKQLIAETRMPIPMKRGRPARVDYEYERNGTANLFMLFAPLEGWRHVEVTDRHTAIDYAHVLKDLADRHFPHVKTIVLVQDNLNIHSTPKHGSWLDLAESELGFYPPNASIGAFPTNRPSLRKSLPGKTTATPITPRQTGNSQPKLPVSNLNTYTLQSS